MQGFTNSFVQEQIGKIKSPVLLVVDEAHNFGARSYAKLLDERFTYRLALSATLERHRDEEGTATLYSFFGKKCIEYSLERAIEEEKLTPYKYYPILVYLNDEELEKYEQLSYEMSRHVIKSRGGKVKLDSYGEMLAIQRSRIVAAAALKLIRLKEVIAPYKDEHMLLCGYNKILTESASPFGWSIISLYTIKKKCFQSTNFLTIIYVIIAHPAAFVKILFLKLRIA